MYRAEKEQVPASATDLFLSTDPDKDANQFQELLQEWYWDDAKEAWHAEWSGFHFPWIMDFSRTTFEGGAAFSEAAFGDSVDFSGTTFKQGANFARLTCSEEAVFQNAEFQGHVSFAGASFRGHAIFTSATFGEGADFSGAVFSGRAFFYKTLVPEGELIFPQLRILGEGSLELLYMGTEIDLRITGAPHVVFGPTSLSRVTLRGIDAGNLRFVQALDIDKAVFLDMEWPRKHERFFLPDEAALDEFAEFAKEYGRPQENSTDESSSVVPRLSAAEMADRVRKKAEEVERIYRAIRKNYEDQSARVTAHDWYFSEMEVGRRYAPVWSFRRGARKFYRTTSNYGLSAARPFAVVLLVLLVAFVLFSIPTTGICPVSQGASANVATCVGWTDRLEVVLLATFLQPPPSGISLAGPLAQGVWLLLRLTGAAMIVSIAVAFRNQVAR
jgi:uncharacterized protein YjbI with pentapeptide repeats